MVKMLTDKAVAALPARAKMYHFADPQLACHYVRVTPSGGKSYSVIARDPRGKQVGHTIGSTSLHTLEEARELARTAIKSIKAGADHAAADSFAGVAEQWFKRHVQVKGLSSEREIRRYLDLHILPAFIGRDFESVKRSDVAKLLDRVEDKAGPVAADMVLSRLTAIFNFYAARNDDYRSPIVKGMKRSNPRERAGTRILTDDEIRMVWEAANGGSFGGMVKLLLLTGQRREKVSAMRWSEIKNGVWTIPVQKRQKGHAKTLELPTVALEIINSQPRYASNPYVFAGRGKAMATGYSKRKLALDALVPIPAWKLHDLRRTARSLLARAGISSDVAEQVLGHKIKGVEAVYNLHTYDAEKAHALKALAGLIETILRPVDNVVALRA
jgi:integrase